MLDKYLEQTTFASYSDFMENFKVKVPENFNFGYDIVDQWAEKEPNKKALLWCNDKGQEIQFTFADIKRESDKAASYLLSLGIGAGDMVLLILKRRYQFWPILTALHKIGAVAIPATHLLTSKDIIYRCNAASVGTIIAVGDTTVIEQVEGAMSSSPSVERLISIGEIVPEGWEDFNAQVALAAPFERPAFVNNNDDISLMYFTSGTTSEPKMVAHDFLYPLGHIITAAYWHNLTEESLHLTLADTGWGKAVWGKYYGQWIVGANIFVYDFDKFEPLDIIKMIEHHKITSFCAPPTVFRFLIKEDLSHFDISSLKYCTIAGEALNPSVFERWKELTGLKLMEGFGQTETTLTIGTYPYLEPKPGSMGCRGPIYDIDLVDGQMQRVKNGEQGEVIIRLEEGKRPLGLFREYYKDNELTNNAVRDGVYHTGDIAWRDDDGYFWFVGRIDDVIKSSGYRVGPFEVESVVMQHPAVLECAVTGVPDEVRGQIIKATIVLAAPYRDSEPEALKKEIQKFVKSTTAPYKYPRIVEFVDELPKTISGKIRRVEIRAEK